MIRQMTSKNRPARRAMSRRTTGRKVVATAGGDDFGALLDLIDEATKGSSFNATARLRLGNTPVVTKSPGTNAPPTINPTTLRLEHILADAKTEDQQLRALETAARADLALPAEASIAGSPITAQTVTYSGQPRAGLRLDCTRNKERYSVNLADVAFLPGTAHARFVSLYRSWLGLPEPASLPTDNWGRSDAQDEVTVGRTSEFVVLACKSNALRCRLLGSAQVFTLRTAVRDEVPGAIISVAPTRQWTHARHAYLAGSISSMRFDVEAWGLAPLELRGDPQWSWDPKTEYWREEGAPLAQWESSILERGKRPMFEMEQVVPGADLADFDSDPIVAASELNATGDRSAAQTLLSDLLAQDLRCVDAHAHLGNFVFDDEPAQALRHYELGVRIGILACGKQFDGVLSWSLIDNRPFLRCMHGLGLCAWRLGHNSLAAAVFRRLLLLNPADNQGARFCLAGIDAGEMWRE